MGLPDPEDLCMCLDPLYERRQRQELLYPAAFCLLASKIPDIGHGALRLHFVSYKKIPMYLGSPRWTTCTMVYVTIDSKQILLTRVFIRSTREALSGRPMSNTSIQGVVPTTVKSLWDV